MLSLISLISFLGALTTFTSATALTYKLVPNEKECFYTYVEKPGSKIAFYFAVQSGGSFDSMILILAMNSTIGVLTSGQLTTQYTDLAKSPERRR